jgi:hypothetical protein
VLKWLFLVETRVFDAFDATFDRNLDVVYGLSVGQTRLVGCTSEGLVDVELRTTLSVGEKDGRFWHARTPKSHPPNCLFLTLLRPKINTAFRYSSKEATGSQSQKISSDLLIVCK